MVSPHVHIYLHQQSFLHSRSVQRSVISKNLLVKIRACEEQMLARHKVDSAVGAHDGRTLCMNNDDIGYQLL